MTEVHQLTRDDARRIAVTAQLATAERPGDLLGLVRALTFLQSEPTSAVAPSAEVVAWSRIGLPTGWATSTTPSTSARWSSCAA